MYYQIYYSMDQNCEQIYTHDNFKYLTKESAEEICTEINRLLEINGDDIAFYFPIKVETEN